MENIDVDELIKSESFKDVMVQNIENTIEYFLKQNMSFGILCNLSKVEFEPELPDNIKKQFQQQFTFFVLANYTLESAYFDKDYLNFEAGFGEENFASLVKVPKFAIFQIILDDKIVGMNLCATVDEFYVLAKAKDEGSKKSIDAILSNPNNKAIFGKK